MEVKIQSRSRWMQLIALALFMTLVWAYAQLEWGVPQGVKRSVVQSRGTIVARDGTVLARSVDGKRVYPQGALAGQVLGMMGATEGLEGLEAAYNRSLEAGQPLRLTLDPATQSAAEAALARYVPEHEAQYGSVVALETRTGRILAAASYPPFDPNKWRVYSAETRRNRPLLDVYEPGSTIKALIVAAAINEGLTTPNTVYDTPMRRYVGERWGSTIGDSVDHPARLTTRQILRYSSNVGMSHIVEEFEPERMRNYLRAYGFGDYAELPTVASSTGTLQPLRNWNDLVRATNAFGQGMSGTTLQLAAAYNVLANDGRYVSPRLVEGEPAGERRDVLSPATARTVRTILKEVVKEAIPTQAGLEGYDLMGKTGTSQVSLGAQGYSSSLYDATFAGIVSYPADTPRVTIAVMAHGAKRGHHGSQLAAPIYRDVASDILSRWGAAPTPPPPEKDEDPKP